MLLIDTSEHIMASTTFRICYVSRCCPNSHIPKRFKYIGILNIKNCGLLLVIILKEGLGM